MFDNYDKWLWIMQNMFGRQENIIEVWTCRSWQITTRNYKKPDTTCEKGKDHRKEKIGEPGSMQTTTENCEKTYLQISVSLTDNRADCIILARVIQIFVFFPNDLLKLDLKVGWQEVNLSSDNVRVVKKRTGGNVTERLNCNHVIYTWVLAPTSLKPLGVWPLMIILMTVACWVISIRK